MTNLQKITITIGCSSILFNSLAILGQLSGLGFFGLMLGRLSGLLYLSIVDRFRPTYCLPLLIATSNTIINSEYLIFTEMTFQQVIYQIAAYRLFTSGKLN